MNRHLTDERLIELSVAGTTGVDAHLADCADCRARHTELTTLLGEIGDVVAAEADVHFSDDRLVRQRGRILQRIELDGRPGRLIAFPAGQPQAPVHVRARPVSRWVAAAAVAGLVVGLLTGQFIPVAPSAAVPGPRMVTNEAGSGIALRAVSTSLSDAEFLVQVEAAGSAGPAVLQPLDALTPRAWEVAQ
jgi:hypothetical protein